MSQLAFEQTEIPVRLALESRRAASLGDVATSTQRLVEAGRTARAVGFDSEQIWFTLDATRELELLVTQHGVYANDR